MTIWISEQLVIHVILQIKVRSAPLLMEEVKLAWSNIEEAKISLQSLRHIETEGKLQVTLMNRINERILNNLKFTSAQIRGLIKLTTCPEPP